MKKFLPLLSTLFLVSPAWAVTIGSVNTTGAIVVGTCGTPPSTYIVGQVFPATQDVTGTLCTLSGGGGGGGTSSIFGSPFPSPGTAAGAQYLSSPPSFTSGNMVPFQTDVNGNLKVNITSGAGGTFSAFSTTFPTNGTAAGAEYLVSPPTLSNGNMVAFQTDVNGNLKVNIASGGATGGTSSNFASSFPAAGTASGAEYLSSPPTLTSGNMVPFQTDVNGNLKVNIIAGAGGGTSSSFGSALPATGTAAGAEYLSSPPTLTSGNMVAFQTDVNGNLKVNIASGGGSGGTNSNFASSFPTAGTASGAEYLTSPPTLSNGNMVPFQTDVNGNLKVNIISGGGTGGTASNFGSAIPSAGTASGAEYLSSPPTFTSGNMVPIQTDVNGNLKVNIVSGGGSGGTASTFGAAFPGTGTAAGAEYLSSPPTLTTGNMGAFQSDVNGNLKVTGSGAAGTAVSGVMTVQGIASMTPVQVSQATASNLNATVVQSTASNLNATVIGSGSAGTAASGVMTVQGIASMTPVQVSQATASNLNATVVQGTASNLKAQVTGSGTAGSADAGVQTVQGIAGMTPFTVTSSAPSGDACIAQTHHFVSINQTGNAQIIVGTSSKKTYICSINLVTAGVENVALVEGTGSVCSTNIAGLAGGTTAAAGWNFVANGGLTEGNGGAAVIGPPDSDSHATAANLCLLESGSDQISGQISYVQQ